MADMKDILDSIEEKSNDIVAKLESLRELEEQKKSIESEITTIKKKLEDDEITKFSYATMLEANKKNMTENTNSRKKAWDELAETVNKIGDLLNTLKEDYNKKIDLEETPEIKETKN